MARAARFMVQGKGKDFEGVFPRVPTENEWREYVQWKRVGYTCVYSLACLLAHRLGNEVPLTPLRSRATALSVVQGSA